MSRRAPLSRWPTTRRSAAAAARWCFVTAEPIGPRSGVAHDSPGAVTSCRFPGEPLDAGEEVEPGRVERFEDGARKPAEVVGEEQQAERHEQRAGDEVDGAEVALDPAEHGGEPAEGDTGSDERHAEAEGVDGQQQDPA